MHQPGDKDQTGSKDNSGGDRSKGDNYEDMVLGRGPEAAVSANAARHCKKNPGHKSFIPVYELTKGCLPELYQEDEELFNLIKTMVDLTVRVRCGVTSSNRPDGGLYGTRGGIRTGTGCIWNVELQDGPCQCCACEDGPDDNRKWWMFGVMTAKHVVFDEEEAGKTEVDLFYDSEDSRHDGRMLKLKEATAKVLSRPTDYCLMRFKTCNAQLVSRLQELLIRREELSDLLRDRYVSDMTNNFVFIVSHPHGIAKHVTFGEIKAKKGPEKYTSPTKYSYSAATCAGSSGAMVIIPGLRELTLLISNVPVYAPHHCMGGGKGGLNVGYIL